MHHRATKFCGLVSFIGLCITAAPTLPQTWTPEETANQLPTAILRSLHQDPSGFQTQAVRRLFALSPEGVATPERVESANKVRFAQQRAQHLRRFFAHDLDGDGQVTKEELETIFLVGDTNRRAETTLFRLEADKDQNGIVTYAEAVRHIDGILEQNTGRSRHDWDLMVFDMNGDKTVDVAEVSAAIEELTKLVDGDPSLMRSKSHSKRTEACVVPQPSEAAKVVVLTGYEGDAVSTVAVSGQGRETSVATVIIEEGNEPLWIFATALDSVIWNMTGATDRIERFVAQPQTGRTAPAVGVVGLEKGKVSFVPTSACMRYLTDADDGRARIELARMTEWLPRQVDKLIAHYTLAKVSVPSGRLQGKKGSRGGDLVITEDGRKFVISRDGVRELGKDHNGTPQQIDGIGRVAGELRRYYPGGIVEVPIEDVLASSDVEPYEVLPQQAGLLQLMRSGALRRTDDGYFLIQSPISRFPAGLNGGHSVRFILGKGVPMPAGSSGHSPVFSEETGECIVGTRC
ncbi:MAG: EF-hand domain-containing protein [Pseudomonadota bacterium]